MDPDAEHIKTDKVGDGIRWKIRQGKHRTILTVYNVSEKSLWAWGKCATQTKQPVETAEEKPEKNKR